IVELMGGRIGAHAMPEGGSRFEFTLPLERAERALPEAPFPVADERPPPAPSGASRRILVAEDNPVNQILAQALLDRLGHYSDIVTSGAEARAQFRDAAYALVLMDIQMPEMDGLAATRAIRRLERSSGRRVPIVAMTANAFADDRAMCLEAGMDDHLAKPID